MGEDSRVKALALPDAETARVVELLRGASRGPRDPDVELAELLPGIEEATDETAVTLLLERLVRDANQD